MEFAFGKEPNIVDCVDGGWIHSFNVGYWLSWQQWDNPENNGIAWSAHDEYCAWEEKYTPRKQMYFCPAPIDKPIPPEGILVYNTSYMCGGSPEIPLWRYFPRKYFYEFYDKEFSHFEAVPATKRDWLIIKSRLTYLSILAATNS